MVTGTSGTTGRLAPRTRHRRHLAGNTDQRQAVGAVRRQFQREQAVVEIEEGADRLPDRRVVGQHQQAGGIFGDAEFPCRAQHAGGLDAAHLGDLDREIAGQAGAGQRARHLEADGDVRRAADDLLRLRRRRVSTRQTFRRSASGCLATSSTWATTTLSKAGATVSTSSTSRPAMVSRWASSSLDRRGSTKVRNQDSENFMIDYNCLRKRRSPSKNRRRSLTP